MADEEKKKRAPRGHVVVYVGEAKIRHVVPISCLNTPQFRELLAEAASVYGYSGEGGITLPCDEATFRRVMLELGIN